MLTVHRSSRIMSILLYISNFKQGTCQKNAFQAILSNFRPCFFNFLGGSPPEKKISKIFHTFCHRGIFHTFIFYFFYGFPWWLMFRFRTCCIMRRFLCVSLFVILNIYTATNLGRLHSVKICYSKNTSFIFFFFISFSPNSTSL